MPLGGIFIASIAGALAGACWHMFSDCGLAMQAAADVGCGMLSGFICSVVLHKIYPGCWENRGIFYTLTLMGFWRAYDRALALAGVGSTARILVICIPCVLFLAMEIMLKKMQTQKSPAQCVNLN